MGVKVCVAQTGRTPSPSPGASGYVHWLSQQHRAHRNEVRAGLSPPFS